MGFTELLSIDRGHDASCNTRTRILFSSRPLNLRSQHDRNKYPGTVLSRLLDGPVFSRLHQAAVSPSLDANLVCFALVSPSHYPDCSTGSFRFSVHPTLLSRQSVDVCSDRSLILYPLMCLLRIISYYSVLSSPLFGIFPYNERYNDGTRNVHTTRHDLRAREKLSLMANGVDPTRRITMRQTSAQAGQ